METMSRSGILETPGVAIKFQSLIRFCRHHFCSFRPEFVYYRELYGTKMMHIYYMSALSVLILSLIIVSLADQIMRPALLLCRLV